MSGRCGGFRHSGFLDGSGNLWMVGYNGQGQLGSRDTKACQSLAQKLDGLPPLTQVAFGAFHTVCVSREGRLFYFGKNFLDPSGPSMYCTPKEVEQLPPIRAVACGDDFTICIARNYDVWAFGANKVGQLGVPCGEEKLPPTNIGFRAVKVACGSQHTMMLGMDDRLYACGSNEQGQYGTDSPSNGRPIPVAFAPPGIRSIYCGYQHTLLLTKDRSIWGSGCNEKGELGLGDLTNRSRFEKIPMETAGVLRDLACGWRHTMVISEDNRLWGWGHNREGSLSQGGEATDSRVLLRTDARAVVVGYYTSFVLTEAMEVICCGQGANGQLGMEKPSHVASWYPNPALPPGFILATVSPSSLSPCWEDLCASLSLGPEEESTLQEISYYVEQGLTKREDVPKAPLALGSWSRSFDFLQSKKEVYDTLLATIQSQQAQQHTNIQNTKERLLQLKQECQDQQELLSRQEEEEKKLAQDVNLHTFRRKELETLMAQCQQLRGPEEQRLAELEALLQKKPLRTLEADEMDLVWWGLDLTSYQEAMRTKGINGTLLFEFGELDWHNLGLSPPHIAQLQFVRPLMANPSWPTLLTRLEEEECLVCMHHTPRSTVHLLKERGIPIPSERIIANRRTTPYLAYAAFDRAALGIRSNDDFVATVVGLRKLQRDHMEQHPPFQWSSS